MANYKVNGIIINRTNFGESDRLVTILTDKKGKIRAIAKGVKKTLSKLSGHIELFCLTKFVISEGRNLDIITDAQIEKCFINLRSRLKPTSRAYYLAEIIDKIMEEEESHPKIFILFEEVLDNLNSKISDLLIPYFEFNFLADLGYSPELYKCIECNKKIVSDKHFFSFSQGGLVCSQCKNDDIFISNQAIKAIRLILKQKLSIIKKIKTDKNLISEIVNISENYIKYISQEEFKTKKYIYG